MSIKISVLWLMWLGWVIYDAICIGGHFFPEHTPHQRFTEDSAVAFFIIIAWINARWFLPAASQQHPAQGE